MYTTAAREKQTPLRQKRKMGDNVLDKDKKLGSLYHLKVCALQQHREKKKQQRER